MRASRAQDSGIAILWDAASCPTENSSLYWGYGSSWPSAPGGAYLLSGAACGLGASGTFSWNGSPDPTSDPSRLVWWVLVANDGRGEEGSWGKDSSGNERNGPQASGQCGSIVKDVSNPGC